MKKKIIFATGNAHKLKEATQILAGYAEVIGMQEIGVTEELPETGHTLKANAVQKAKYVAEKYGVNCVADDTGLEVMALNGEPGVYSARYAGENRDNDANMNLLLQKLVGKSNRQAQFKTILAFVINGTIHTFEGVVEGQILPQKRGNNGFGYDPIFQPKGYDKSFGEMTAAQKNDISHRARALAAFRSFLSQSSNF